MNARRKVAFSAGGVADISRETITFVSRIVNTEYT